MLPCIGRRAADARQGRLRYDRTAMRHVLLGPYTSSAARRATGVALFFQWFIVVTGATVRLTGSGLGCPSWPSCTETSAVPALEQHALIEWANRMTATPTLITAVVACWVCWRLVGRRRADLRFATTLVVGGVLVQAGLGALTVLLELPPGIVAVHFLLSIAIIAAATFAWHAAGIREPLRAAAGRWQLRTGAGLLMLASLLAVIVAGVLTTASGPHSGAAGTGHVVERFGFFELAVTLHARGAYAFLLLVLLLTWARERRGVALRDLGMLLGLVVVQVALGELQYRTGLPWQLVLAHVATAALIWLVAVRIAVDAAFRAALDGPAAVAPPRSVEEPVVSGA